MQCGIDGAPGMLVLPPGTGYKGGTGAAVVGGEWHPAYMPARRGSAMRMPPALHDDEVVTVFGNDPESGVMDGRDKFRAAVSGGKWPSRAWKLFAKVQTQLVYVSKWLPLSRVSRSGASVVMSLEHAPVRTACPGDVDTARWSPSAGGAYSERCLPRDWDHMPGRRGGSIRDWVVGEAVRGRWADENDTSRRWYRDVFLKKVSPVEYREYRLNRGRDVAVLKERSLGWAAGHLLDDGNRP